MCDPIQDWSDIYDDPFYDLAYEQDEEMRRELEDEYEYFDEYDLLILWQG